MLFSVSFRLFVVRSLVNVFFVFFLHIPSFPSVSLVIIFCLACQRHQYYLDKATPHVIPRWLTAALLSAAYCVRVFFLQVSFLM